MIVCILFSACSKAMFISDSNTSSVTYRRQTELLVNVAPYLGLQVVERWQAMHELDPWIAGRLQQSHVDLML